MPASELMELELRSLLGEARSGELPPADFDARLTAIHTAFLGADANATEMVEARLAASRAYEHLCLGTDRHHDLEQLANALGVDQP